MEIIPMIAIPGVTLYYPMLNAKLRRRYWTKVQFFRIG
jgi:hypothetical protein